MSLITVTNTSGVEKVILGQTVAIGGHFHFDTFCNEEYLEELRRLIAAGTVSASSALDIGEIGVAVVEIDHTPDTASGIDVATVGFQLKKKDGSNLEKACVFDFNCWTNEQATGIAYMIMWGAASVGTILKAAGGGQGPVVLTDSTGKFTMEVTDLTDHTVYFFATMRVGSVLADVSDYRGVTFTA